MEFVVDANVLFSALIKDSLTANMLFEENVKLFTAEFMIEEFLKYEELLIEKSKRTREQFVQIMHMLKDIIISIPKDDYLEFMKDAKIISPDENDAAYFALALKLRIPIWSNDKRLKQQDKIKVYNTNEVFKLFTK
jgi:predicted nucleic acid-binding protein